MKRLSLVVALAVVLLCGCSFRDGIYVVVREGAVARIREDLSAWLIARGFERGAQGSMSRDFFALKRASSGEIGLFASFQSDGEKSAFFIGKGNTRDFSSDEIVIVSECAAWLSAHAEAFERGTVSKASTVEGARREFYARIKKG